ncbi:MAG: membrane dipeptidase [Devosia nanyangense]|uniref:Membrane dipeptidase n=1 Tax=Devosia nanyangense TaxID=1228055 RepID=A0A933L3E3_9HYPH|nr:membrane dipeptidase [Devosia nanyangense]
MTDPIPFFDGHNDFLLRLRNAPEQREKLWLGSPGTGHLDLGRMKQAGFAGGLFAIYVPSVGKGPGLDYQAMMKTAPFEVPLPQLMTHEMAQPVALAMAGLLHWMERAAPDDFTICRSAVAARAAFGTGKVIGIMHMEGAEAIGPDLDALYLFHDMGLRSLGPVWSRPTIFGHGVPFKFPGDPDTGPGLTDTGKALVRLCNELGVMIDLSHMNAAGFEDVARLSQAPLVATHSNVHALCPSPRNLTDRQLDQIRDTSGMVGLNFATGFLRDDGMNSPDIGLDVMVRHVDYLIEKLGEDHVGLGSDFDGCTVPDPIKDVTGVPNLFRALADHGYDAALLAKLAHGNWLGCLDRSLKE